VTPPRTAAARVEPARFSSPARAGVDRTARSRPARAGRPPRLPRRAARHRASPASRTGRLPFLIASFVLAGILVVGVASLQAVVSQGSFRMQDLTRRNAELRQEYGRLKLQVAELSSPGRIAAQARRLGFHLPDPDDVRTLRVKGLVRMSTRPERVSGPILSLSDLSELGP
jgi:cell division protein FtsL